MASITSNPTEQQREKPAFFSTPSVLDIQDDFHKMLSQTKALVTFMLCNDNMEGINRETINNLLWLVQDRLDDMEASYNKLTGGFIQ